MSALSTQMDAALNYLCTQVEDFFGSPVMSYVGQIHPSVHENYVESIERVVALRSNRGYAAPDRIVIVLTTPGGVAESVEKMVEVTRHHFAEVYFAVPYAAMSAGTIFCMSGDKIYMDYTSSLGPIDPQVPNPDKQLVPALGYIDKVEELIEKSRKDNITSAELMMLQRLDLATLRRYEQARDLSVSLLKKWLVRYKFKDWVQHQSTNPGTVVTQAEKEVRAEDIARSLSDNQRWHSHGRMIGIDTLTNDLKLKIEDYSTVQPLRNNLRSYSALLLDFIEHQQSSFRIHYRYY